MKLKGKNSDRSFILSLTKWQIKLYFVFAAFIIVIAVLMYSRVFVEELIQREQRSIKLYTDIFKKITEPDANIEDVYTLVDKISPTITFPMITTDDTDEPIYPYDQWTLNIAIDTSETVQIQKIFLKNYIKKMANNYDPIVVEDIDGKVLHKFYYTHSSLIDQLQLLPLIEMVIVAIFIIIGYIAFSNIRRSEESKEWVGMSKEAAHQLGTPLSSLLAWLEIMKYKKNDPIAIEETIKEIENDINRLNIIATRFSKIGSKPEKRYENIGDQLEKVCQYFEKRLPHLGRKVQIERSLPENIFGEINAELFAWVIENLLKNSAEAIDNKVGKIEIDLFRQSKKKILISCTDNGKGMTSKQKRQIFQAGYTTKKRGWGLGLSLSRRIIEDYHDGKIYVKESTTGKGTTFMIELPAIEIDQNG